MKLKDGSKWGNSVQGVTITVHKSQKDTGDECWFAMDETGRHIMINGRYFMSKEKMINLLIERDFESVVEKKELKKSNKQLDLHGTSKSLKELLYTSVQNSKENREMKLKHSIRAENISQIILGASEDEKTSVRIPWHEIFPLEEGTLISSHSGVDMDREEVQMYNRVIQEYFEDSLGLELEHIYNDGVIISWDMSDEEDEIIKKVKEHHKNTRMSLAQKNNTSLVVHGILIFIFMTAFIHSGNVVSAVFNLVLLIVNVFLLLRTIDRRV